jgi:hypothetical protein
VPVVLHREDYILWIIHSYSFSYPADFTEFKQEGVERGGVAEVLEVPIERNYFISIRCDLFGVFMALEIDLARCVL